MSERARIQKIVPLTPMQEGLYLESLRRPGDSSYVVQLRLACEGELDTGLFRAALSDVAREIEVLRTVFLVQGKLRQIVLEQRSLPCAFEDLSELDEPAREARIAEAIAAERREGFDLARKPLLRFRVFRTGPRQHEILSTNHHVILDGWSMGLLWGEILACYEARAQGRSPAPTSTLPFSRFVEWLGSRSSEDARAYWKRELADRPENRTWPRRASTGYVRAQRTLRIDPDRTAALRAFASSSGATVSSVVLAAWTLVLRAHADSDDVTVGAVVSGRAVDFEGAAQVVGLCIQTVPVRVSAPETTPIRELVRRVHQKVALAQRHGHVPLAEIQAIAGSDRGPLFDHLFVFENYPLPEALEAREGANDPRRVRISYRESVEQPHYDLNLICMDQGGLEVRFLYDASSLDAELVAQLERQLELVLARFAAVHHGTLGDAYPLAEDERLFLVDTLNATSSPYPRDATIDALVEARAAERPDAIAVTLGAHALTYRELVARSHAVAAMIADSPRAPVALLVETDSDVIAVLLGILRAGRAYLPIDPDYPAERIGLLLRDAGVRVAIAARRFLPVLAAAGFDGAVHVLEDAVTCAGSPTLRAHGATDDAYVLYTSGSTGTPKGCVVTHRNVVRLITGLEYAPLGPGDTLLQTGALAFDASTLEIWGALANGATLALASRDALLSAASLRARIVETGASTLWLTSPLFNKLVDDDPAIFPGVRRLLVGGDVVSPRHVARAMAANPGLVVVNGYGPTENTTFSTVHVLDHCDGESSIPIGRPIRQSTAYVVDRLGRPCPIGVPGELWVGGDGVARGYLSRPELTGARFVPDPFAKAATAYRTGDLARVRPDGAIEFLGRVDHQVKIRGLRIELGEVERHLAAIPDLDEVHVAARGDRADTKVLCAWYTSRRGVIPSSVREALRATLPAWAIPTHLVRVDVMPLTRNGKIDERALPEPGSVSSGVTTVAPSTPTEAVLLALWKEVLGVTHDDIGIEDDFFDHGGHSLRIVDLHAKITRRFGVVLPIAALFEARTVRTLASRVDIARSEAWSAIEPLADRHAAVPLSPAQRRMFIVDRLSHGSTAYNVTGGLRIEGIEITREQIQRVVDTLLVRHEALRTALVIEDGVPVQRVVEGVRAVVEYDECSEERVEDELRAMVRPFDLGRPPLVRWKLLRVGERRFVLLSDAHHAVLDGWSVSVLAREILAMLGGHELPAAPVQYRDFAAWQHRAIERGELAAQERAWIEELSGELPALDLPTDRPRPRERSFRGATHRFVIPPELATALRALARRDGSTLFMTLLAVFDALLVRTSGQSEVVVGIPVAARTHSDVRATVGAFVNMLPIRTALGEGATFAELLSTVRAKCLAAYDRQDTPFETLVERLTLPKDGARNPVFDAVFTLQAPFGEVSDGTIRIGEVELDSTTAKFDLTMIARERGATIDIAIEYSTDLFRGDRIERMASHFLTLAEAACAFPETPVDRLPMLTAGERRLVVETWNDRRDARYPSDRTAHAIFEERARRRPSHPALRFEGRTTTYGELDAQANRIARALADRGVRRGDVVALLVGRSPRMIAAILAVAKAGAAYVPLDPTSPRKRLEYMLVDSGARILVTESDLGDRVSFGKRLLLDVPGWEMLDATPPDVGAHATDLLQVMYTSGSTGKPKGVLLPHRGIIRTALNRSYLEIDPDDRLLQLSNYVFDGSTFDIFGALLNGATLVLVPEHVLKDVDRVGELVREERVTKFLATTALFNLLVERARPDLEGVRAILFGGQAVSAAHVQRAFDALGPGRLVHMYGPSETSVYATHHRVDVIDETLGTIPIGVPLDHTRVYVVDRHLAPQPIGVAGEIVVGGDALALGYLNRPELTEAAFVADPFVPRGVLYRTGDIGCWLPDGTLRFLGRRDHQVKIRGLRVETGEIETRLLDHPAMRAAHVAVRDDVLGNKSLVAYVVCERAVPSGDLRSFLAEELPDYMIPAAFVALPELPLTRNGKIDDSRLPAPTESPDAPAAQPARTASERTVAAIWSEVLGPAALDVQESFFDRGGNSLTLVRVHERLVESFPGLELRLVELFEHTTIERIAALIDERVGTAAPSRAARSGDPLADARARAMRREQMRARRRPRSGEADEEEAS
ncbi:MULTISPECIES: non-ribosomal peptide synthetase [Sandaracinus]|uniref:non-ribosomal peptide synthetase n=1 Tax=Sandaracinus TaxID=1055688 RepID=UPI0019D496EE|nr:MULTISPECIES: non-ribosomal peptide synthetase [Sandaracinus]QRN75755.1 Amino acid adenylation domain protein [Sandaracinus sp.]UJR87255.1 Hypothetical protein I5071_470 [Sandaracinus amylolyticus]